MMTQLSRPRTAGHVLGMALGLAHLSILGVPTDSGEPGPPLAVALAGAVVGVAVIALLAVSWRRDATTPRRVAAVLLFVAALGALPGLLVSGVDVVLQLLAGALVLLTVVAVVLLFYPRRSVASSSAVTS
jgi:hypothetical protein